MIDQLVGPPGVRYREGVVVVMTEERSSPAEPPPAVRPKDAVEFLAPAAKALGRAMNGQTIRRLVESGELKAVRPRPGGWRSISRKSLEEYKEQLEELARQAAQAADRNDQ